jgi:hypothetical protein
MNLDIQLKSLFEHDVSVYGDDAYCMWEYYDWLVRDNDGKRTYWNNFLSNKEVLNCGFKIRRKNSAALPFDLTMAKSGNAFEVFDRNPDTGWSDAIYVSVCEYDSSVTIVVRKKDNCKFRVYSNDLRMKYPPKLTREKK